MTNLHNILSVYISAANHEYCKSRVVIRDDANLGIYTKHKNGIFYAFILCIEELTIIGADEFGRFKGEYDSYQNESEALDFVKSYDFKHCVPYTIADISALKQLFSVVDVDKLFNAVY